MKTNVRSCFSAGVTLIELLVVTAIVAILAALLLPAIEGARSRSKSVKCMSQLQQIGIAFHSFANDHEDKFPAQVSVTNGGALEFAIAGHALQDFHFVYRIYQALSNDLLDPKVLICPSDRDPRRSMAPTFATLTNLNISYFAGLKPTSADADSWLAGDSWGDLAGSRISASNGESMSQRAWSHRHNWRCNILFADGHIESLPWTQLVRRATSPQFLLNPVPSGESGSGTSGNPSEMAGNSASGSGTAAGGGTAGGGSGASSAGRSKNGSGSSSGFAALQSYFQAPGAPQAATSQPSSPETPSTFTPVGSPSSDKPLVTANQALTNTASQALTNRTSPHLTAPPVPTPPKEPPEIMATGNAGPVIAEPHERSFNWLLLLLLLVLVLVAAGLLGAFLERRRRLRRPTTG
jgi:prepilin-type N-terminal cleavage/methylation domain-containing protein/prepilin-type processing-associated H-X9-DG protein